MTSPEVHRSQFTRNARFAFYHFPAALIFAALSLLLPLAAHAQSAVELEAEIARLQKLLAQTKHADANASTAASGGTGVTIQAQPVTPAEVTRSEAAQNSNADNTLVLDKVVVSGAQSIKEIPKSIGVVSGAELDTFHVNNFRDILNRIGNVRTSWQNPQTTAISIRGVGWSAGTGVLDPSVGVSVDGVSYGVTGIAALANFTDIDNAQVVRGPQGVDGGRQTSVGRVVINTTKPSFTSEANAELILGQLHNVTETASIGGSVIDGLLAYRISIHRETAEGPFKNKNDEGNTYRNTDRTSARISFLLTPSKDLEATLSVNVTPRGKEMCENCFNFNQRTPAYYDNIGANGQPIAFNYANDPSVKLVRRWFAQRTDFSLDDFYSQKYVDRLSDYPNTYSTKGAALNVTQKLDDKLTITSITAYQDFHYRQGRGGLSAFNWVLAPQGTETDYWQASQELKLDWQVNPTLKSQTGAIYFRREFPLIGQLTRYGPDAGAWYANAAQYAILDPVDPALPNATSATGWDLLKNSADGVVTHTKTELNSHSEGVYSNLVWSATPNLTFTAGARATKEHRSANGSSLIESNGYAAELNPVSVNNVQLNGFANDAAGNLTAANSATQLALADFTAQKYFAAANYGALTAAQKSQVATAKAIRAARIGALYQQTNAKAYDATLPTFQLGSTYRINPSQSVFASWEHGTKAGVSQIVGGTILGGKSVPVDTETSDSFNAGFKSLLLDNKVVLDVTVFLQNIRNYIQNGVVYDPVQTALNNNGTISYLTTLINVPKVQTKGAELNLSYSGIPHTILRFTGAYTDAVYKDFKTAGNPWELSGNPAQVYTDQTGHVLAGAPKFSGNVFGAYSYPIGSKLFHANVNYNFTSSYYSDQSLSRYLLTPSVGVTDINVGLGRRDGRFDVSVLVKNAFNADTGVWLGDQTPIAYKPRVPRWVGLVFRAGY